LSEEVNVFSTRRLATVAKHFTGDPGALEELGEVLDAARADGCGRDRPLPPSAGAVLPDDRRGVGR
jgi:hypothetical protein